MRTRSRKQHSVPEPETASELLFQEYLQQLGIDADFEPKIQGIRSRIDFRLASNGTDIFCELKELHEKRPHPGGATSFDPYSGLRKQIHEGRKKFKEYKEHCCVLVVHNIDDWQFRDHPQIVYGAMLGNLGLQIPYDPQKGALLNRGKQAFFDGGKMIDYRHGKAQNTTIRAIAVLTQFTIPNPQFEVEFQDRIDRLRQKLKGEPAPTLCIETRMAMYDTLSPTLGESPRLAVFENPLADPELPPDVFRGPFDLRYRYDLASGRIERVFVGEKLSAIEETHNDDIIARIDRFSRAIAEKYNPERILLFGSYANDCPNADSDVDILVVFPGNGDVADRSLKIRTALNPDFPLDLLTRSAGVISRRMKQGDYFLREITETGKTLY
ncbi:MAG: nucleotidyltransferase domain-containing protein, partial [Planctomycetes bacterium]|nr:nucleotidyltransferase domain-containing protein [Planctomycetota bacterium]